MFARHPKLIALAAAGTLAVAGATEAVGSAPDKPAAGQVGILERPDHRLDRTIAITRYGSAYARARGAGVAPKRNLGVSSRPSAGELAAAARRLRARVREQRAAGGPGARSAAAPATFGISQATLDAIASCESGGDPSAVSADGTYRGKYQFTVSAWASVGGSGDPAAAPEAEQDMRAAMLYARVGPSAWPVCGQ